MAYRFTAELSPRRPPPFGSGAPAAGGERGSGATPSFIATPSGRAGEAPAPRWPPSPRAALVLPKLVLTDALARDLWAPGGWAGWVQGEDAASACAPGPAGLSGAPSDDLVARGCLVGGVLAGAAVGAAASALGLRLGSAPLPTTRRVAALAGLAAGTTARLWAATDPVGGLHVMVSLFAVQSLALEPLPAAWAGAAFGSVWLAARPCPAARRPQRWPLSARVLSTRPATSAGGRSRSTHPAF